MKNLRDILNESKQGDLNISLLKHYNFNSEAHETNLYHYSSDSMDINNHLWNKNSGKEIPYEKESKEKIKGIDDALGSYKTPHEFHVYSGIQYNPKRRMDSNRVVNHPGYLSTSIDKNVGRMSSVSPSNSSDKHFLRIKVPKDHPGAYVESVSPYKDEKEFLLPRDTKMKHIRTSTEMHKGNKYFLHHMEIV